MLRLKQIDVVGFKSFANRERLRFAGNGIAAVVGPNGCGKSNICDAVSWVLGEQSAKSLRGSRMRDVIFNGTRNRAASGLAAVTLTLHDAGRMQEVRARTASSTRLPPGGRPGEITVARKLFANGESQYILNGKAVRLRDVQDLFLGTGLGPNHYAIIEQGRIGQLLTSRPLDRRAFVEEAAGVTRFKARRKLAELKLANASQNLERVHDILEEVRRQANSLKSQARRAERHERYRARLREAQCVLFASRYRLAEAEGARLQAEDGRAREALAGATAATDRMESEFGEAREREREWERRLEADREEKAALQVETGRRQERIDQQARAVEENSERRRQALEGLDALAERIASLERGAREQRNGAADLAERSAQLRAVREAKERECGEQAAAVAEARAAVEACRTRLDGILSAESGARGELGKLDEAIASHARAVAHAEERLAAASAQRERALESRSLLRRRAEEARPRAERQKELRAGLVRALAERRAKAEALRKSAEDGRAEVSRLVARRDSLQEMLDHRAYTTEAVKDIFEAVERHPGAGFRPLGLLADFLDVDEGYENAVEQFLGEDLEHVVVGSWAEAGRGVRFVREEFGGRAAFLVRFGPEARPPAEAPSAEDAEPLTNHVRATAEDGGPVPSLPARLLRAYLVRDEAAAERLAEAHSGLHFLLPNGSWYSGSVVRAGRRSSSGPLALRQQLRELAPALAEAQDGQAAAQEGAETADEEARRAAADLETATAALHNLERDALAAEHELRQVEDRIADLDGLERAARGDIDRAEGERAVAASRRAEVAAERGRLETDRAAAKALLGEQEETARTGADRLEGLQEARSRLRTEEATLDERRRAADAALRADEAQLAEERQRRDLAERQIARWAEESDELVARNRDLERRIEEASARLAELDGGIQEAAANLRQARSRTTELTEAIRDQRAQVESAHRECSRVAAAVARIQSDLDHLAQDCVATLGEEVAAVAGQVPDDLPAEAVEEAESQRRDLEGKIERLGPVNVLARDEYEEVAQRQEFLETQEADLMESIANTRTAIREIDEASRTTFDDAFRGINEEFRRVFATLFGGGVGEMRLSDPGSKDESGIDIVAQPPGKKLQSVALLSGGEKSLTVMALLLATFRYKPSPFCILDEVDSQLDEANTLRLRRLLQEMAPETQFIVITHAKATMEAAETLYGVTMGEAGVSKLVSVRMADSRAAVAPVELAPEPALALGA